MNDQSEKTPSSLPSRRTFLKTLSLLPALPVMYSLSACSSSSTADPAPGASYSALSEEHTHLVTYMAFASNADGIWSQPSSANAGLDRVRSDLIDVAKAIGAYEPVTVMVLSEAEKTIAQGLLDAASTANGAIHTGYTNRASGVGGVTFVVTSAGFNDYWTRDTAPLFVNNTTTKALTAINFNFNGWGNANSQSTDSSVPASSSKTKKASFYQHYANDQKVAAYIAQRHNTPVVQSTLTLEGGALELDGEGTAIVTQSSVLHVNRNPQLFDLTLSDKQITGATLKSDAKATVEAELKRTLGVTKVIWITGTKIFPTSSGVTVEEESDITNGHTDFYAKFLAPGVVAYANDPNDTTGERDITAQHLIELTGKTDAKGRTLTLVELRVPATYGANLSDAQKVNFAAGYINFYVCNNAIILPKFGDATSDSAAVTALSPHRGTRTIVQVDITGIASGGGGLHCATSQVPVIS